MPSCAPGEAACRTDLLFRLGLIGAVLVITSFLAGLPWGLPGVAACYFAANLLNAVPYFVVSFRLSGNTARDLAAAVRTPLLASAAMVVIGATIDRGPFVLEGRPHPVFAPASPGWQAPAGVGESKALNQPPSK